MASGRHQASCQEAPVAVQRASSRVWFACYGQQSAASLCGGVMRSQAGTNGKVAKWRQLVHCDIGQRRNLSGVVDGRQI